MRKDWTKNKTLLWLYQLWPTISIAAATIATCAYLYVIATNGG